MSDKKELIKELQNVVIVDALQFKALPSDKLVEVSMQIANFKNAGKEVKILSDLSNYTSLKIIKHNAATGLCLKEHLEYFTSKEVTDEQFQIITNYANAQKALDDFFETKINPNIDYPFAEIPEDYETGLEDIEFKLKLIKRGSYSIGYKAFEEIWEKCIDIWLYKRPSNDFYIRASGSNNRVSIYRDKVSIGCQSIPRFQVEQVALKLNLPFKQKDK
ncbi:hypothetical protein [uncultured Flavobacterium sp.]|uniref:hypothetical protein n=1 Tax=uncultured Flavobacterium sp. TaxID=165435 RepID=UPI00259302E7|nr:hypothetical protein [uncultured Flavobacterium sp.]